MATYVYNDQNYFWNHFENFYFTSSPIYFLLNFQYDLVLIIPVMQFYLPKDFIGIISNLFHHLNFSKDPSRGLVVVLENLMKIYLKISEMMIILKLCVFDLHCKPRRNYSLLKYFFIAFVIGFLEVRLLNIEIILIWLVD